LTKLAALKGRHRYNFHVGLVSEEEIKALAPLADVVSFDFVGDDATIRETLKLHKQVADYVNCYQVCCAGIAARWYPISASGSTAVSCPVKHRL
jgi:uncharacterized radical SAM superfamily protein